MTVLDYIIAVPLIVIAAFFCYISSHMVQEKKEGKRLPLFWEKDLED